MRSTVASTPPCPRSNHADASVEVPPSIKPRRKYCDITGLPVLLMVAVALASLILWQTEYSDPKTGLRYYNATVYQYIRTLSPEGVQQYLRLRNAHTVVK